MQNLHLCLDKDLPSTYEMKQSIVLALFTNRRKVEDDLYFDFANIVYIIICFFGRKITADFLFHQPQVA